MMPKIRGLRDGITFVPKTISVRSDQNDFLKRQSISLSRFVQQKIDELMNLAIHESKGNKAKK